jgi:hypothetical protein
MKTMGRYTAKAAASLIPAATVARLGMPALGALVLLAVLIFAFACWVIGNQDRTNRASQILLARRGTPVTQPALAVPPTRTGPLKWMPRLATGREKQRG